MSVPPVNHVILYWHVLSGFSVDLQSKHCCCFFIITWITFLNAFEIILQISVPNPLSTTFSCLEIIKRDFSVSWVKKCRQYTWNTVACHIYPVSSILSSLREKKKYIVECWHADNTVVPTELCWNSVTACPISYLLPTSSSTHSWIQNAFAISRQRCISVLKLCCNTPLKRQTTHLILTLW